MKRRALFSLPPVAAILLCGAFQTQAACTTNVSTIAALPTLGGSFFQANALNNAGQITGFSSLPGDTVMRAFLIQANQISELGTLGGTSSQGFGINASGQIFGASAIEGDTETHAFLYSNGTMSDLGTLGGPFSFARAINDNGQVAGDSLTADFATFAFLYTGGSMTNLGALGGNFSTAAAINNAGVVIGNATTEFDAETHGFVYTNGAMSDLGTLGGGYSAAFAINQSGVIVGESTDTNGALHAFAYIGGAMNDLGTLGGADSTAAAVNNSGQVIGESTTLNDAQSHGFFYSGGVMTDLGTLGGDYSHPSALNNLGQVVGDSATATTETHAFLWQNGTMVDLNTLLPENSGWVLVTARFVNDNGTIVGDGITNGVPQWYVFSPGAVSANNPPVASAGPDQSVSCQTPVTLDGSNSSDLDGDALVYEWSYAGNVFSTNAVAVATFALGTNQIVLKVTDPCGASSMDVVVVTVSDTTAPTGSIPSPITIPVGANCQAAVPDLVSTATVSDNCTATGDLIITQNPTAGTLLGKGQHLIAVTVTDASGNSSVANVTLNIVDTTAPVIVNSPSSLTVSVGANCSGAVPNVVSQVSATDNCGNVTVTQSPVAGALVSKGQHTVTVTATDDSGNSVTANVTLNVVDTTAPSFVTVPSTLTVSVGANCSGAVPNVVSQIVATDNCGGVTITQNPAAGTLLGKGSHTISVTVTDASGNSTSTNVTLNIVDATAPVISTISANPSTISPPNNSLVPVTVSVTTSDNCDPAPVSQIISITANEPIPAGDVQITGALTAKVRASKNSNANDRVYTITVRCQDASGNSSTRTVTVTVLKNKSGK